MCGIAGYFGKQIPEKRCLVAAANTLGHRGPDGEGFYTVTGYSHEVALVHRRLAIIDPNSRSDQPFLVDKGVLVFNGEIYNYLELRRELSLLGHEFKTDGDTEVLARALRQWGEGALDRLEGMWAFAWYDERDQTLLLSRDRFGEKPLYLWQKKDELFFASEVKALVALANQWPEINQNHLIRYLVHGYKGLYKTSETFYAGVEELPRASNLRISREAKKEIKLYWTPQPKIDESMSYNQAVEATRNALIAAVGLRLRADAPLAFCMSGGVDSNSLISIARRVYDYDVHGFTIMNTDQRYEEEEFVTHAVKDLGIRHTRVFLKSKGFVDNLRSLVLQHDAPISTISYYLHWQLMQAMSNEGYKISISGTAADELFTGYYDHHNLYLYQVSNDKSLHAEALEAWRKHQAGIVKNPYLQDPDLYIKNPSFRSHIYLNNDLFSSWLKEPWEESFTEVDYGVDFLRNRMMNELFTEVVPVMLNEDDLNAMAFSLENRSPFLDRKLFDVAFSIPTKYLIQDARAKAVLRDAMRGIVPQPVLDNRRKVGFNAPILDLLDFNDSQVCDYFLDDSPIYHIVQKEHIEKLITKSDISNSSSKYLFNFLNVKIFLEEVGGKSSWRCLPC